MLQGPAPPTNKIYPFHAKKYARIKRRLVGCGKGEEQLCIEQDAQDMLMVHLFILGKSPNIIVIQYINIRISVILNP